MQTTWRSGAPALAPTAAGSPNPRPPRRRGHCSSDAQRRRDSSWRRGGCRCRRPGEDRVPRRAARIVSMMPVSQGMVRRLNSLTAPLTRPTSAANPGSGRGEWQATAPSSCREYGFRVADQLHRGVVPLPHRLGIDVDVNQIGGLLEPLRLHPEQERLEPTTRSVPRELAKVCRGSSRPPGGKSYSPPYMPRLRGVVFRDRPLAVGGGEHREPQPFHQAPQLSGGAGAVNTGSRQNCAASAGPQQGSRSLDQLRFRRGEPEPSPHRGSRTSASCPWTSTGISMTTAAAAPLKNSSKASRIRPGTSPGRLT